VFGWDSWGDVVSLHAGRLQVAAGSGGPESWA
jgi:hypothetical protein